MTRRRAVGVVLAGILLVGCGGGESAQPVDGDAPVDHDTVEVTSAAPDDSPVLPVEVDGADGRTVTVTDVDRIITLHGNIAEVVFALGLGDRVVGRDISTTFSEAEHLPLVTRAHDVTAESVLSLRPTVVLADTDSGPPEALDHIRNVGVPVVVLETPDHVDDVAARIRTISATLGVPRTGEELAAATETEIRAVRDEVGARGDAPTVAFLYLRGQAGVYLLGGRGSGADSMIEAVGARDAGTEIDLDQPFTPITSEALVRAAPEVILMTTTGLESVGGVAGLVEIPGIAQTPAGRNRRVVTIEDGLLYSFGTRTPEALRRLGEGLVG